jgi:hypothetical protein
VGQNNSRDIRKILLQGLLLSPGSGGFTRRGVLHRGWMGGTSGVEPQELKVLQDDGLLNLKVNYGLFVVHRGAIGVAVDEGPYVGGSWGQGTISITMPAAPGAQSRYDAVFARVVDRNIAADSGLAIANAPYIDIIQGVVGGALNIDGTPGTAGAPPATPDGYLPLAFIPRLTSDNTITQAEIVDVRRGTTIPGTPRVLFPWDIVKLSTDLGYVQGEERYRPADATAGYPAFVDRWDGAAWRGTQPVQLPTTVGPASSMLGLSAITAILTKTIPDPGFPYRAFVGATVGCDSDAGATMESTLRLTNAAGTQIGLRGLDPLWSVNGTGGSVNRERQISMSQRPTAVLTGQQIIALCIRRLGGGTQLGALANISELYVEIVPAT